MHDRLTWSCGNHVMERWTCGGNPFLATKSGRVFSLHLYGALYLVFVSYSRQSKLVNVKGSASINVICRKQEEDFVHNGVQIINTHCNQSVVNCFSIVTYVHLVSSNLEIQAFEHLTWPIVSVNFNIIMLHFVLFQNVTCYTNSLLSCVYVNTIELLNITYDCHMRYIT